ncbi:MAG TPA: LpqN/LpqT family lipoprotein [Mycobacterium sp.]|nr:LpqN/LpqT family lipoprotein [Mycobacterium sp.]
MKITAAVRGAAIAAMAVGVGLVACSSAATSHQASSSTAAPAKAGAKVTPLPQNDSGPNPTIAGYIKQNDINETLVYPGDPGAPTLKLPVPDGWVDAGDDTPHWAYRAVVYNRTEAEDYTPSVVAVFSKLTGNVDQQKILQLAPGELNDLPGFKPTSAGSPGTLAGFPAYQLGGTWVQDGQTKLVSQKTVVIPANDGLYVLQLNGDGLQSQLGILGAATTIVDDQTTITR